MPPPIRPPAVAAYCGARAGAIPAHGDADYRARSDLLSSVARNLLGPLATQFQAGRLATRYEKLGCLVHSVEPVFAPVLGAKKISSALRWQIFSMSSLGRSSDSMTAIVARM